MGKEVIEPLIALFQQLSNGDDQHKIIEIIQSIPEDERAHAIRPLRAIFQGVTKDSAQRAPSL